MDKKLYIYIKQNINIPFITMEQPLKEEEYNNIGVTWEDYLNNKWVLLSDEQVAFLKAYPTASRKEVWDMQLPQAQKRTLVDVKGDMLAKIIKYDESEDVNSFIIGDQTLWLNAYERGQLSAQINANEIIGRTSMTKWFKGKEFTFPLSCWKQMLAMLEVYAGDTLNVTEMHKAAINNMQTIEEVVSFDYTKDYPERLNFNTIVC